MENHSFLNFKYQVNWNILLACGIKINRDFVSSGEWKQKRVTTIYSKKNLEKFTKEGDSPVKS
jgi:hypothetical protein